ncbi:MAG: D-aminopeptidase dipeptide-binding protein DppA [uncultured Rubrobacteraceae bacterium]|uniref:D-aminopeptidase dipeptide-binding protein DppA n=1 Tax=uncultured Rubrobacteraceae bacterium TaxID=349277 RepID=A0A6J4QCD9_9ACTN|nr:MAG: D-aminopeptidase dipeptide-binding protein DppA [uncultured Rubrobacteraceae bacterium]
MRVFISADMEGVTGVTHPQDVIPGRSQYERFRRFLTADVNAAIEGASQGGATEFLVNEAHDGMRNILLEDLDERAELIVGSKKPLSMMQGFEGADVAFFVGYHARAGAEGVLSHTFNSPSVVTDVQLNGEPCSEARMNATLAGLSGIPVGLVTGDDPACEEAESLYANVRTAQVKTAVDRYTARCLPQRTALERIRGAAEAAVHGAGDLAPYAPGSPYTFTVEFATASTAAGVVFFPQLERVGDRIVSWTHDDYETAFKMFIGVMRMATSDPDYG